MNNALLIYSRYPRLGQVKTRLSSLFTPAESLELHRAFLLDTLDRTATLGFERHLFLADCSRAETDQFAKDHRLSEIRLHRQEGQNLGDRMWNGLQEVVPGSDRIIFLGTDTPSLPLKFLDQAPLELSRVPVVLGPADDGGYYLLGLSEPRRELFRHIDWGTPEVLAQSIRRLKDSEYALLPPWYDVDTPDDLKRLLSDLNHRFPGFPERTHRFLEARSPIGQ